jgi:phospholipid/cholesterol/gamma-HCH transport system ATP-binding protein
MIIVKNLYKSYGRLQVLKGLNLEVFDGETVVILGRSGVGKSVLLRQIIGIEAPDKGSIAINNVQIATLSQSERLKVIKGMGMLFQGAALFDSLTVGENTAFYLRQHELDLTEEEIQKRVSQSLDMVGLSGQQNTMPSDLSGGMRKRAAIARLIVYRPKIILYDEPTTGLDPITANQINNLINETQKNLKATSIVVTHDIRSAMEVGNRLAFHHDGKIIHIAPKEEFFKIDDPLLHDFFQNAILTKDQMEHNHGAQ